MNEQSHGETFKSPEAKWQELIVRVQKAIEVIPELQEFFRKAGLSDKSYTPRYTYNQFCENLKLKLDVHLAQITNLLDGYASPEADEKRQFAEGYLVIIKDLENFRDRYQKIKNGERNEVITALVSRFKELQELSSYTQDSTVVDSSNQQTPDINTQLKPLVSQISSRIQSGHYTNHDLDLLDDLHSIELCFESIHSELNRSQYIM